MFNFVDVTLEGLSERIFLDRYAKKELDKTKWQVGARVVAMIAEDIRQPLLRKTITATIRDIDLPNQRLVVQTDEGTFYEITDRDLEYPQETQPKQMWDRVASALASVEDPEKREEVYQQFAYALNDWKLVPGGRVNAGAGTDDLTLMNCFVINSPHDSRQGIFRTAEQMTEIMARGGGVGINLSTLRPRRAIVHGVNGHSSGAISWGGLFSFTTGLVEQGGSRRGALMLMLWDWHPDLLNFITAKSTMNAITNANLSLCISDAFMKSVKEDGEWKTEFPVTSHPAYDTEWDGNLPKWKGKGYPTEVYATYRARDIWQTIIESAWKSAEPGIVFMDMYNNYSNSWYFNPVICTNPCITGDTLIQTVEGEIQVKDLVGKEIDVYCMTDGEELAIRKGFDFRMTRSNVAVYKITTQRGESIKVTDNHPIYVRGKGYIPAGEVRVGDKLVALYRKMIREKYCGVKLSTEDKYKPEHRFILSHYDYIEGYDVHHKDENTLNNKRSNLTKLEHDEHSILSNEGHRDWALRCEETGQFLPKEHKKQKEQLAIGNGDKSGKQPIVASIEFVGYEDVYNFEVEEYHNYIANNLVVHNCGEQGLPGFGVCNLSAINLSKCYDEIRHDVDWDELRILTHTGVRMCDNVTSYTMYPLPGQKENQEKERRSGLGTMGLAELLIKLEMRYGSPESLVFLKKLYGFIAKEAYLASAELAKERGSFEMFDLPLFLASGFMQNLIAEFPEVEKAIIANGMRNVTVITQAPTGSTGTMVGTSTGIEPYFAFEYTRKGRLGEDVQYVPIAQTWKDAHPGQALPNWFVTAQDLSAQDHVRVQAVIQRYTDSSISKTANAPHDFTVKDTADLYELAYELGCKGVTIYRDGSRDIQVLSVATEKKKETPKGLEKAEVTKNEDDFESAKACQIRWENGQMITDCGTE